MISSLKHKQKKFLVNIPKEQENKDSVVFPSLQGESRVKTLFTNLRENISNFLLQDQ